MNLKKTYLILPVLLLSSIYLIYKAASSTPETQQSSDTKQEGILQKSPDNEEAQGPFYTLEEISKHSSANDCWTVIEDGVYDLTEFVASHPGGPQIISACGIDGTELFKNYGIPKIDSDVIREDRGLEQDEILHSQAAQELRDTYKIGRFRPKIKL